MHTFLRKKINYLFPPPNGTWIYITIHWNYWKTTEKTTNISIAFLCAGLSFLYKGLTYSWKCAFYHLTSNLCLPANVSLDNKLSLSQDSMWRGCHHITLLSFSIYHLHQVLVHEHYLLQVKQTNLVLWFVTILTLFWNLLNSVVLLKYYI